MRMSDLVTQYILNMLEAQDGSAEIKRNERVLWAACPAR